MDCSGDIMKPLHQADRVDSQLILEGMRQKKLAASAPTLIIGIPSRGKVSTEFMMSLIQLFNPLNMVITYVIQKGMLPAEAREAITKYALKAGAKYIFFVDDDMLLPPDTLYRLNQRMQTLPDAAIVSGIYSSKFEPVEPFVYKKFGTGAYWDFKKDAVEQVWAVGAGCLLVNLEYVKKMKEPYWLDEYGEINGRPTFLGQDINFCHKIQKEAGGKVYIDSAINCGHQDINSGRIFHIPDTCNEKQSRKLHLGCGGVKLPGFINIDLRQTKATDMVADIRKLPFEDGTIDEIHSYHVIEHFSEKDGRKALTHWYNLLKENGKLILECPDLEGICARYLEKGEDDPRIMMQFYGADRWENDAHLWGYSKKSMKKLLENIGFENVSVTEGKDYHATQLGDCCLRAEAIKKRIKKETDIIIPCWNQLEYTKKCIESIQRNTKDYNLILIDNGSTDGTAEYFKTLDAVVITNKENLGFVKAVNQGLKASKNDVVILNNDTEVPEGWLDKMKEVLTDDIGAVGPLSTAPAQEQYYKEYKSRWQGLYLAFFCVLIKREVIDKVGELDENFEIGLGEDQDYCNRMALAGYRTRLRTDVIVKHHHRVSIKEIPNIEEISIKNHQYLRRKWSKKQNENSWEKK